MTTSELTGLSALSAASAAFLAWAVRGRASSVFGPSVHHGPRERNVIALTFDDGPSESTPNVLELLDKYQTHATFFQIGANVERLPHIARAVHAAGHEIGNHSHTHPLFCFHSAEFIYQEFARAQRAIADATGFSPTLLRAPYGARWFGFRKAQHRLGLRGVMWTAIGYALIDACRRRGLRFVLAGHESSAASMAQVFGQIKGVPGVCVATLGPGATNLVTGDANAFLDRAPLLALTAQIPGAAYATMSHQRVALDRLFSPITKRSSTLGTGDSRKITLSGMRLASAPRPGPVHLALPSDVAVQECGAAPAMEEPIASRYTGEDALSKIAARVNSSERPLALIGLGADPSAAAAIRALVNRLQAPFLVTPKVKGILSEDDPRFLGVASGMAIDRDIF